MKNDIKMSYKRAYQLLQECEFDLAEARNWNIVGWIESLEKRRHFLRKIISKITGDQLS